jgi:hypothetical protein
MNTARLRQRQKRLVDLVGGQAAEALGCSASAPIDTHTSV